MSQNINLKENETKSYMYYHNDGLIDIYVGLSILLGGICMLTDIIYLAGVFPVLCLPVYRSIKKSVTAPRIKNIKFPPEYKARASKTILTVAIIGVLVLVLGVIMTVFLSSGYISPSLRTWLWKYMAIFIGVILAFCMSVVAFINKIWRFYAYAVSMVIIFTSSLLLNLSIPLSLTLIGALMLLVGVVLLVQFLSKYPKTG